MSKRNEFLLKLARLILFAESQGLELNCFSMYRTPEQQHQRFMDGKSFCDGYKKKSRHQMWRAADFCIIKNGDCVWERTPDYEKLGQFWKNLSGTWGGDWSSLNDIYHFEA